MARGMIRFPVLSCGRLALVLGLCFPVAIRAAPEPVPDVLGRMEKTMSGVKTVKTRFVQEKKMALFNHPLVTRGSILVEPPSRLLWRVDSPMRYVLSIQDQQAKQWDGETGKTQTMSLDGNPVFSAVTEQLNAWFGGRYALLAQDYDIVPRATSPAAFAFVPRPDSPSAKMLKSVTVTFREDERYIASIRIDDRSGDVTTLTFEDTEINVDLPPEEWEF